MNYRKIDPALAATLNEVQNKTKADLLVFIQTNRIPSPDQANVLERLGINEAKSKRQIFTATLSAQAVEELSEQPWVSFLKLSRKLNLL
ncbi:MAG: hypothetical protein ACK47N_20715 [Microcystis sp.]|jgi:hypothetical protein|uniref:hypothetical protein n=1 Tax=Microcystis sp. TaxID=1127 RepID=UPI00391CA8B2|nr:hypothetical protein [Microcystis aeruginosa LG13-13]NCR06082.1 hypothetical protein [Microcystis aeruginosa LG13-03]NCR64337.1 hypothetical protein [Microcystis aeruginosa LG11-05]